MIFLTVGSALPFDRLVRLVDATIATGKLQDEVFAQIGEGEFEPEHMEYCRFLDSNDYMERLDWSSAVISHAGIGTINTCLRMKKPLLVMPRRHSLGELVDDHQLHTAEVFAQLGHLLCFQDQEQLCRDLQLLSTFKPRERAANPRGIAHEIAGYMKKIACEKRRKAAPAS